MSFPKIGHPACAWIALVPLIVVVVRGARRVPGAAWWRGPFVLGLTAGAVGFGVALYWVVDVMHQYGGLSRAAAVAVGALLVAYLSLFPAAFAVAVALLWRRVGEMALLLVPAVWVATEFARAYVWSGFPWILLGASQAPVVPVAQLASLFGVFGLSALITLVNGAAALVLVGRGWRRAVVAVMTLGIVAAVALWGQTRVRAGTLLDAGEPLRVGIVQGNFSQDVKWDPALVQTILHRYLRLTVDAANEGARFVIWPESSAPFFFELDAAGAGAIRSVVQRADIHLLVGSDDFERPSVTADGKELLYNAAFLLAPDGEVKAVYRKMRLVPFGEYVPLARLLFFVGPLVKAVSSYSPGEAPVLLPIGGGHRVSTAICYEVVYPDLMRRFVLDGSELLTTITNDAWFGRSSAAFQHFEQARLRAVEQGRFLVRSANTGISGVVDPYGRVLERSSLFETAVLVRTVRLLEVRTVYAQIGDVVAYLSVALTGAALLAAWRVGRRRMTGARRG